MVKDGQGYVAVEDNDKLKPGRQSEHEPRVEVVLWGLW